MPRACIRCPCKRIPDGKYRCPDCGSWQWADTPSDGTTDGSIVLEDITSANVDRMITGPWDVCFGSAENDDGTLGEAGIVRGSSNMIGGSPGAGKSTLFLQMAAGCIEKYELPVLYLSAEEQLPQIRARADRLKLQTRRLLRFVDLRKGTSDIGTVLKTYQFGLLILDSLKALAETPEDCIAICKAVKEFTTFQHAPAVISQHVTKGLDMAGLMALQHEVDSTMTFFPDEDIINGGEAIRVLETKKNRNGRAFTRCWLDMTARGLMVPLIDPDTDVSEKDSDSDSER